MARRWLAVFFGLALGLSSRTAEAQSTTPFQLQVAYGTNSAVVPNGANINLQSNGVGVNTMLTLTATNNGSNPVVISTQPQIVGSTDFSVVPLAIPVTVASGGTLTVVVNFKPSTAGQEVAQLSVPYVQSATDPTQPGTQGAITLTMTGSTPQFSVGYALEANSNAVALPAGGNLQFLPTSVGTTATATVIILNNGTAPGAVNSIAVTGSAFQALGLPLLPATLASGGNLQFEVQYSPTQIENDQGTLTIVMGSTTFTANLLGSAVGPNFSYVILTSPTTTPVTPGQTIPLPNAPLSQTTSTTVQVTNTGNASGVISTIAVTGPGFALANLPFLLPLTLAPNATAQITVNFAPQQAGAVTGSLRIGNDLFSLSATGLGANLIYSYAVAGTSVNVLPSGTVLFSPTVVSQTLSLEFTVSNTGTQSALISSIGVASDAAQTFSASGISSLPLTLQPGAATSFSILFAPKNTGQFSASLSVNAQSFTLSGFGTSPPALPSYQITGPSAPVGPFQQPSISLTFSQPYPLSISGTLTLQINSASFAADPAVQFSSGGTTVTFTIPANQTQAIFPNGSTQIRLQTGTVAGTISIVPAFSIGSGLNLTPNNPPELVLTVPSQSPTLLAAQVTSQTTSGFTLAITGYATTRALTTLTFAFALSSGITSPATTFSVDVSQASSIWFNSPTSQASGGEFFVAVPFSLQTSTGTNLSTAIQSVSVTAVNALGSSNSLTASIQQ